MSLERQFPNSVSIYEALRTRPDAAPRLARMGVTRELYDYRLPEAARRLGVPVERLTAALQAGPAARRP